MVDDDPGVRGLLAAFLEERGFAVDTAADGEEAVARLREHDFDVVVTDIVMPNREGIETIIEMRRMRPSLGIIAISGGGAAGAAGYLESARLLGADGALEKPFSLEDLQGEIDRVLQARDEA